MITFKQFNESWARGAFPDLFTDKNVEHPDDNATLGVGDTVHIHSPETGKRYNDNLHSIHSIVHDYDGKPYATLKMHDEVTGQPANILRRSSGRAVHVPLAWLRHAEV